MSSHISVVAVTCLALEARIAAGPGVSVICGHAAQLVTALEDAIRDAEQQVREASRDAVARLRDQEEIGDVAFQRVIGDLDLDELRNIDEPII